MGRKSGRAGSQGLYFSFNRDMAEDLNESEDTKGTDGRKNDFDDDENDDDDDEDDDG